MEPATGALVVETSWLPDEPGVAGPLRRLGFARLRNGSYHAAIAVGTDQLSVARALTRALAALLEEIW